jgi:tRNA A-37 threonylcarbamoyl transferase component Bud32/tetratricopeptide (TPR) repeat protein
MAVLPRRSPRSAEKESASEPVATRYRIEKTVGEGGMGSVFKTFDQSRSAYVALKRLTRHESPKQLALFEREYHTLAGIRHPHIVEVYDYGADQTGPFYTMELLTGGDLRNSAPLPYPQVCRILRDVASALALLHARHLLHRDISPRNVWRCPDGRIKVIDFGALAAFGGAREVAGTPPFIAPEALHGRALDQRSDLFSVGALGYWLLTAQHAFPAREIFELPELWRRAPRSPSARVAKLERPDLPAVPPALDALIEALLSHDPLGRPTNAGEVIDRLCTVAELESERSVHLAEGYLGSTAFVGRSEARAHLSEAAARCREGDGSSLMLEAQPGMGRTRLLTEFALEARLKGFVVLHTDAQAGPSSHSAAHELALRAIDALPTVARSSSALFAPTLAHLSPELCRRLALNEFARSAMPHAPGEARMRIQSALCGWFLAMARVQPIAILVDDLDALDEASAAFLAALAHEARGTQILIVSSLRQDEHRVLPKALAAQRQLATQVTLPPLSSAETQELLRSVFGEARHLGRVAELLHRLSQGSPAHVMELAEYLVKSNIALYLNGSWVLPQTLEEEHLPATRGEMFAARLRRLSEDARALGQVLSVHQQSIPLHMCAALSGLSPQKLFVALESLVREGVLSGSPDGYRFCHEALRRTLFSELDPARSRHAHRHLGELLMKGKELTTLMEIEAGVHLLLGGDRERGERLVSQAGLKLGLTELTELGPAAPWLAQALRIYRDAGKPDRELVPLLSPLALSGYYVDRKLADQYGDEAVKKLAGLLRLPLALRLRPFLGRKLSLFIALGSAAFSLRVQRGNSAALSLREAITLLFNCVAALTGVSTICINPERAKSFASVIEPLTALGKDHVATLMHQFCLNLAATVQDRIDDAYQGWTGLLERLESSKPIQNLPDSLRVFYVAGALYARGVMECWRDDSRALDYATRLDALNLKLYEMSADQVRMMYFGCLGNMELFERYRERVEMHAIKRGTAWQAETWSSGASITVYLRTYNAQGSRQCEEQLRELSREVPSLQTYADRVRGTVLLLRGKQDEALPELEKALHERGHEIVGWARSHGVLARAYNELGAHKRAREVCEKALASLSEGDLAFTAMNQIVQVELAIADAALGQHERAAAALDALLEKHTPYQAPLTLGALHDARARVAQRAAEARAAAGEPYSDDGAIAFHLDQMQHWYRMTGASSLIERCDRMVKQSKRRRPGDSDAPSSRADDPSTIVEVVRHGGTRSGPGVAQWSLEKVVDHVGAQEAFLYSVIDGVVRACARVGEKPAQLDAWALGLLKDDLQDAMREADAGATVSDHNEALFAERPYRLIPLYIVGPDSERLAGGLVLPSASAFHVPPNLLHALANRLDPNAAPTAT